MFPPKSSILIGFSIINHPFWGTPIFGNTHMYTNYTAILQYKRLDQHNVCYIMARMKRARKPPNLQKDFNFWRLMWFVCCRFQQIFRCQHPAKRIPGSMIRFHGNAPIKLLGGYQGESSAAKSPITAEGKQSNQATSSVRHR